MRTRRIDKPFLALTLLLTCAGFFIFTSASFKLLSTNSESSFFSAISNQFFLGVVGGLIALTVCSKLSLPFLKKWSPWIFLASLVVTALVFIPGVGFEAGGARRWIGIFGLSFQPSEFLKIGTIIYLAALFSHGKDSVRTVKRGWLPLVVVLALTGAILLAQPDTDTYGYIVIAGIAMFITAGGKWKHLFLAGVIGVILFAILIQTRPYLKDRVETFLRPQQADSLGSGYQIEQSLIAIGSGGFFGKGFGQSIQKFGYLPEPTTDSIFAVAAEEFGFVGSLVLICFFILFGLRGLSIARNTTSSFGRNLVVGVITLIIFESYFNIASLTGLIPLAGTPLLFVSHGGTALFFTLAACGLILNISKHRSA